MTMTFELLAPKPESFTVIFYVFFPVSSVKGFNVDDRATKFHRINHLVVGLFIGDRPHLTQGSGVRNVLVPATERGQGLRL